MYLEVPFKEIPSKFLFHLRLRGLGTLWVDFCFVLKSGSEDPAQPWRSRNSQTKAPDTDSAGVSSRRLCFPRQVILQPSSSAWAVGRLLSVFMNKTSSCPPAQHGDS